MNRRVRCIGIASWLFAACGAVSAQPYFPFQQPQAVWRPARPLPTGQPARRPGFFERLRGLFSRKPGWEQTGPRGLTRGEVVDLDFDEVRPSAMWLLRLQASNPEVRSVLTQRCRFVMTHDARPLARASAAWMHDVLTRPQVPPVGGPPVPPPVPTPPVPPTVAPTPTAPPTPPPTVPPEPTPVPPPTPVPTEPPIPTDPPPPDPPIPTDPPPPDPTGTPVPTPPPGGHFIMKAGDAMASKVVHQLMAMTAPFMPPPPKPQIPQEEQKAIQQWIDAGCHEDTFATAVKPIFDRRCNTCHSAGVAAGGISFGTYQLLKLHIEFPAGQ